MGMFVLLMGVVVCQLGNPLIISEGDEKLFIQTVKDMQRHQDAFRLSAFDQAAYTKPPFLFFDAYILTKIVGSDMWVYRSVTLLYLVLLLFIIMYLYRDFFPDRDKKESWLCATLCLSTWGVYKYGSLFMMDIPLTVWVLVGYLVFRSYMPQAHKAAGWFGVIAGLSVFMKGPIGWVLSGVLLLAHQLTYRNIHASHGLRFVGGSLIAFVLTLGLGWAVYPSDVFWGFVSHFFGAEHAMKFEGPWFRLFSGPYPLVRIWGGWLYLLIPFFLLPLAPILTSFKQETQQLSRRFLWLSILGVLVLFSIPSQRQENYILLTTPLACILITRALFEGIPALLSYIHQAIVEIVGWGLIIGAFVLHLPIVLLAGIPLVVLGLFRLTPRTIYVLPPLALAFWIGVQAVNLQLSSFQYPTAELRSASKGHIILYQENFTAMSTWVNFLFPEADIWPLTDQHVTRFENALLLIPEERYISDSELQSTYEILGTWSRWKRAFSIDDLWLALKNKSPEALHVKHVLLVPK